MTPRKTATVVVLLLTVSMIAVISSFFYLVPYNTIPNKQLFWAGYVAWAAPMILVSFVVTRKRSPVSNKIFADAMIAVSLIGGAMLYAQTLWPVLQSVTIAVMPGVLSGILVGFDSWLITRIYRGQVGPGF